MKPTHIEHIGIAVKKLDDAIPYYEKVLGLECYAVEEVKDQKVKTAFLKLAKQKSNYSNRPILKDLSVNSLRKKVKVFTTLHLQCLKLKKHLRMLKIMEFD